MGLGYLYGICKTRYRLPCFNFLENGVDIWQFIESRGIHVIPYSFLERRVKSMNVRSLVRDNVAFKLSFGLTFAMAAFAEF